MARRVRIEDTEKSKKTLVEVRGDLTLDEMEAVLIDVGLDLGLVISHVTRLSRRMYPGNRHWHFKRDPKVKGCLDATVTYWPAGPLFWVTIRHREPDWVHTAGRALAVSLEARLASIR